VLELHDMLSSRGNIALSRSLREPRRAALGRMDVGVAAPHRRIDSSVLPLRGNGMLRKPLGGLRT
jgi:hypothetical protein